MERRLEDRVVDEFRLLRQELGLSGQLQPRVPIQPGVVTPAAPPVVVPADSAGRPQTVIVPAGTARPWCIASRPLVRQAGFYGSVPSSASPRAGPEQGLVGLRGEYGTAPSDRSATSPAC